MMIKMELERLKKRFLPMSETMFYILFSLREERHGYGIMQYVEALTGDRIILGAGTVYQTLSKLEKEHLIEAVREIDRKKEYRITQAGALILKEEARRISQLYETAKELI